MALVILISYVFKFKMKKIKNNDLSKKNTKLQQMKQIIEFTKNWKHRNLLHVVGGFLMGAFLSWLFAWYISLVLIISFANYWEFCQKKYFGAKYSISDILLTTFGGLISIGLINFFT